METLLCAAVGTASYQHVLELCAVCYIWQCWILTRLYRIYLHQISCKYFGKFVVLFTYAHIIYIWMYNEQGWFRCSNKWRRVGWWAATDVSQKPETWAVKMQRRVCSELRQIAIKQRHMTKASVLRNSTLKGPELVNCEHTSLTF